ncbi:MAG: dihydropteroate synthase [Deferribacteraceae bacterium]|nr:dihydropteroate synthase [Deferribacteraceae bacterium]
MKNGVKWQLSTLLPKKARLVSQIEDIGADCFAVEMWEKGVTLPVRIFGVPAGVANIIKQEALASGIDAAVSRGTVICSVDITDVIILGSVRGLKRLIPRLKRQGFSLPVLASELENLLEPSASDLFIMRDRKLPLNKPYIMGILNVTPDSFSDGGLYITEETQEAGIKKIFDDGAKFVDVGAFSTRPGHTAPPVEEEMRRLLPAVKIAVETVRKFDGFVSVDTWRYETVKAALELGADMINDQSGLSDPRIAALCAEFEAGICIMHNTENNNGDLLHNVKKFFRDKTEEAHAAGIEKSRIMLDPGFGFKKLPEDNYLLLKYFSELCNLGYPILAGLSRKSMIGCVTGKPVTDRDFGALAAEMAALMNGAAVIRTHNVGKCAEAVKIAEAIS